MLFRSRLASALSAVALLAAPVAAQGQPTQNQQTQAYASDARAHATDAEVRDARRAYRAACQTRQSADYCECMTGGVVQELAPADVRMAMQLAAGGPPSRRPDPAQVERIERVERAYSHACAAYRR